MFLGHSRFRWVSGLYHHLGHLVFPASLKLNDADDLTGIQLPGKPMMYEDGETYKMDYAGGTDGTKPFVGLLWNSVDAYGTTSDAAFKKRAIGDIDIPLKRGQAVTLRVPQVGAECEFEGIGAATVDTLVATATTPGFLANTDVTGTRLALIEGCFIKAQTGDVVVAELLRADLTPENAGELRISVRFVSPYIMPA